MGKNDDNNFKGFSNLHFIHLARVAVPYLLKHFLFLPYFQDVPEINFVFREHHEFNRFRLALYGAMYNLVLESYSKMTECKLRSETGQFVFLVIDLTKSLDEYLDNHDDSIATLQLDDILQVQSINKRVTLLRDYLSLTNTDASVLQYFRHKFKSYFTDYVYVLDEGSKKNSFQAALRSSELDTGMWFQTLIELVMLFNGHKLDRNISHRYYWLGMVGKFADDMVDLVRDIQYKRLNLLHLLLMKEPEELHLVYEAMNKRIKLDINWWTNCCPVTLNTYLSIVDNYLHHIDDPELRLLADLFWVPAILGRDYDQSRHS